MAAGGSDKINSPDIEETVAMTSRHRGKGLKGRHGSGVAEPQVQEQEKHNGLGKDPKGKINTRVGMV
jgi:hypothetical protein